MADHVVGIAIVTGAARGIGRSTSIALRLAADGLDVAINDMSANENDLNAVAEGIRAHARRASTYYGDLSDEVGINVEKLGGVDVARPSLLPKKLCSSADGTRMVANADIGWSGGTIDALSGILFRAMCEGL